MRRMAAVFMCSATMLLVPAATAMASAPDWSVHEVVAGPDGMAFTPFVVDAIAISSGDGPFVIGMGFGDGTQSSVVTFNVGTGPIGASSTRELGGLDVTITRQDAATTSLSIGGRLTLEPDARFGVLMFVVNGFLTGIESDLDGCEHDGHRLHAHGGTGSTAAAWAAPDASGHAIRGGAVAGGVGSTTVDATTGIVGAFGWCDDCEMTWTDPAGERGGVRTVGVPIVTYLTTGWEAFAGPAGEWRFDWVGVVATQSFDLLSAPVAFAYAPIGDLYSLFPPPPSSP